MPTLATDLSDVVAEVAADPRIWRSHVRFNPDRRYWSRLGEFSSRGYGTDLSLTAEVWLLTWLPEQSTDLHDHGPAGAGFVVVQGELTEVRADLDGSRSVQTLSGGQRTTVAPGVIHDVANLGIDPAISIHAYSPSLEVMNFWTPSERGLTLTSSVRSREPEVRF